MKHKHAELLLKYAADAQTSETPWKLWEFFDSFDYEITKSEEQRWHTCHSNFHFNPDMKFRRKMQNCQP